MTALADDARLRIVLALDAREEVTCSALADSLGFPDSTLSRHLRILRESGVTQGRRDGTLRWTRLRRRDLDQRFPGLLPAYIAGGRERLHTLARQESDDERRHRWNAPGAGRGAHLGARPRQGRAHAAAVLAE